MTQTDDGFLMYLRGRYALIAPSTPTAEAATIRVASSTRRSPRRRGSRARLPRARSLLERERRQPLHRLPQPLRAADVGAQALRVHAHRHDDARDLPRVGLPDAAAAQARPDHVRRRPLGRDDPGRPDPSRHADEGDDVRDRRGIGRQPLLLRVVEPAAEVRRAADAGSSQNHTYDLHRSFDDVKGRPPVSALVHLERGESDRGLRGSDRRRPRPHAEQAPGERLHGAGIRVPLRRLGPARAPDGASSTHSSGRCESTSAWRSTRTARQAGASPSPGTTRCTSTASRWGTGRRRSSSSACARQRCRRGRPTAFRGLDVPYRPGAPRRRGSRHRLRDAGLRTDLLGLGKRRQGRRPHLRRRPVGLHTPGTGRAPGARCPRDLLRRLPNRGRRPTAAVADGARRQRDRRRSRARHAGSAPRRAAARRPARPSSAQPASDRACRAPRRAPGHPSTPRSPHSSV